MLTVINVVELKLDKLISQSWEMFKEDLATFTGPKAKIFAEAMPSENSQSKADASCHGGEDWSSTWKLTLRRNDWIGYILRKDRTSSSKPDDWLMQSNSGDYNVTVNQIG